MLQELAIETQKLSIPDNSIRVDIDKILGQFSEPKILQPEAPSAYRYGIIPPQEIMGLSEAEIAFVGLYKPHMGTNCTYFNSLEAHNEGLQDATTATSGYIKPILELLNAPTVGNLFKACNWVWEGGSHYISMKYLEANGLSQDTLTMLSRTAAVLYDFARQRNESRCQLKIDSLSPQQLLLLEGMLLERLA